MGYVTYVEFNVPELSAASGFYRDVFGWAPTPLEEDYHVVMHGKEPGIDTGIMTSRDGEPRTVAVILVDSIDETAEQITAHGGTIVVDKFPIPGVGHAAYFKDPGGLLVGLHEPEKKG